MLVKLFKLSQFSSMRIAQCVSNTHCRLYAYFYYHEGISLYNLLASLFLLVLFFSIKVKIKIKMTYSVAPGMFSRG